MSLFSRSLYSYGGRQHIKKELGERKKQAERVGGQNAAKALRGDQVSNSCCGGWDSESIREEYVCPATLRAWLRLYNMN